MQINLKSWKNNFKILVLLLVSNAAYSQLYLFQDSISGITLSGSSVDLKSTGKYFVTGGYTHKGFFSGSFSFGNQNKDNTKFISPGVELCLVKQDKINMPITANLSSLYTKYLYKNPDYNASSFSTALDFYRLMPLYKDLLLHTGVSAMWMQTTTKARGVSFSSHNWIPSANFILQYKLGFFQYEYTATSFQKIKGTHSITAGIILK